MSRIDDEDEDDEDGAPSLASSLGPALARIDLTVPDDLAGERLDKALAVLARGLAGTVPEAEALSRSRLKALMEQGLVTLDGRPAADASLRVRAGQAVGIAVPAAEPAVPEPEAIPITVVHEDEDVLVVDKPAGLVVHPAAGNPRGTLVNALLAYCGDRLSGIGGVRRPGIVHRLDKDTSGLMVVAKNDLAHARLTAQFQDRSLSRTYLAVTFGLPAPARGTVDAPIGRSPADRKKMAVVAGGRAAVTHYRVLKGFGLLAALVECRLETGRTHQIRVHLAHIGHPLIGDPLYAGGRAARTALAKLRTLPEPAHGTVVGFPRQALHAAEIRFRHPRTAEEMSFTSGLPLDFQALVGSLESI
ncbi:RluA family pseudouridine synthase [Arenibaculum sp.]|jgi:23S rRNA pseudouridine1911/1915/1917 synthase|uniref:RluA family pseudouridine synthase n=1 Tax=Arenibaculum sp. TaxID=2865862 RepID=UPI002E0D6E46|nr:RluA family pseudouridine synthase [Arenibaculum sp.]